MRLVFWNCSVAPVRGKPRRKVEQIAEVLRAEFSRGVRLVALCEMDALSAQRLEASLGMGNLEFLTACEKIGRTRWDATIVFDQDRVHCEKAGSQISRYRRETVRGGQSFDVLTDQPEKPQFRLYVTHWRSRLRGDAEWRIRAAQARQTAVADDLGAERAVVVVGDFNDEPFDASLRTLNAVQDPRLVCRHPRELLYNPSWPLAAPPPEGPWAEFGSYRGFDGTESLAHQYDQALVSAHFLHEKDGRAPVARNRSLAPDVGSVADHHPLELELW